MQENPTDVVKCHRPPWRRPEVPRKPKRIPDGWIWVYDLIDIVGRRLFHDEWTGKEWRARHVESLPGVIDLNDRDPIPSVESLALIGDLVGHSGSVFKIRPATREAFLSELKDYRRRQAAVDWLWQRFWRGRLIASVMGMGMEPVPAHQWGDSNFVTLAMDHGFHSTVDKGPIFVSRDELFASLAEWADEETRRDIAKDEDQPDPERKEPHKSEIWADEAIKLKSQGETWTDAAHILADRHGVSPGYVEREVRRVRKKREAGRNREA